MASYNLLTMHKNEKQYLAHIYICLVPGTNICAPARTGHALCQFKEIPQFSISPPPSSHTFPPGNVPPRPSNPYPGSWIMMKKNYWALQYTI